MLRESEEKYRRQFEEALDAIFLADAETGIIIDCNRAASELVGREKSELVGKYQRILHPPEEIKGEFSRTFKQHLKEKEGQVLETQVITKNGEIKDVAIKANVFRLGNKRIIQGIFRDISERKKVEKALREAEEKYRKTIVNANVGIITYGPEGEVKVFNPKMEEMTGFKMSEVPTLVDWFETLYPNEEERWKVRDKWLKRMSEGGEVKEGHAIITTKEGKRRDFLFNSVQLESGDSIVFAHDITEQKKMEERLLESEERLRNLYENIPDSLAVFVGREGHLLEYNKAFKKRTGYTDEELKDKKFLDFVHPDDRAIIQEKYRTEYPEEAFPLVYEMKEINKKGEALPTEVSVSTYKKKGKVIGIEVMHRDITERKKMEKKLQEYAEQLEEMVEKRTKELRESEEKFKDVFKVTPDSIVIVDLSGNLFEFNETTLDLFGHSREELIRKNFFDFTVEEDLERVLGGMKQALEKGFARIEFQILTKDERKIPVELHASVFKDPEGNRVGFVAVLRDITERNRMEEQLLKSERLAAIGQLATMVGHDLRNPLSAIQNACYYLKMKLAASKNEKVKKMFEVMDKEIDYANNIARDLIEFSRVKKPELKKVDLISSIQDALDQLKFPENTKITSNFSEGATIEADPVQLRRVFQNIALNGAQAMPYGGELTVSTRKNSDFVEVTFMDTGVGMSEEIMDKLFTPLFTTKAQGVGLGLAICKNLIEGHNGRIEVRSKVGEGSTFTIKLPIHQTKGGEKQK